jgi:hypothetical protein
MDYSNRTYSTILTSDLDKVDFSQVMETSISTVRRSLDGTQCVLKWLTVDWPTFISPSGSVTPTWTGTYTECLALMATPEWQEPIPAI